MVFVGRTVVPCRFPVCCRPVNQGRVEVMNRKQSLGPSIMFRCLVSLEDTTLFGTNISSYCLGSAFVSVELGNSFCLKPYCCRRICYYART
ncbi:hypothetical protein CGRA01v4_07504 [Colletotrichum graminicola]|nr:hypothetical protein CGRA01v4_07504 [Colletotrichum graminicola]